MKQGQQSAAELLCFLLHAVGINIETNSLLQNLPEYTSIGAKGLITENLLFVAQSPPTPTRPIFEEQTVHHIEKDTLMPKDLSRERTVRSPTNSNMQKTKTTFKRFASRRGGLSETKNKEEGVAKKFKSIDMDVDEDPQVSRMREKTQIRLREDLGQMKYMESRQKKKQERLDVFNNQIKAASFTFDYEGDSLKTVENNERINCYAMRAGLGTMSKKLKDSFQKAEEKVNEITNKKERFRLNISKDNEKAIQPAIIPLFIPDAGLDVQPYKLSDYRKHFGHRYTRLDKHSETIDLRAQEPKDEQSFTERAHLIDDTSLHLSHFSHKSREMLRKMALPRLNGVYKVLDRYDNL